MRNFIFSFLILLIPMVGLSQDTTDVVSTDTNEVVHEYPKYLIEDGDTIGVIITIDQAQKVDNDLELLELFRELSVQYKSSDSLFLKVIDEQGEQISLLKLEVESLKSVNNDQKTVIADLKSQVELWKEKGANFEKELSNQKEIIEMKDKQLKKNKIQKIVGGIGGGSIIVGLVIVILLL